MKKIEPLTADNIRLDMGNGVTMTNGADVIIAEKINQLIANQNELIEWRDRAIKSWIDSKPKK